MPLRDYGLDYLRPSAVNGSVISSVMALFEMP